jgi:hypothetical protein
MNRGTLLGFFACFILFANAGGLTADVVTFGDPTLEASIRLQLKIPQGQPVTSNEMLGLQDVQASNVSSLQGLQYATNLQRFSLFTSVPVDLSPVGDLPQLNTLDVLNSSSASLNLQPLSGLTSLQSGTFQGPMGNYPAPQNWQSLLSLNVSGGAVHDSDISMISRLNNLQSLTISACPVRNIQPLSQLNKLTAFCIGQTPWTDLSQLSGLTNLQHLFVVDTGITDISSMPALPNLRELDLSWNGIQNISALQRLSQLWVLRMDSTGITDLRPLSTLSQLDALSLRERLDTS